MFLRISSPLTSINQSIPEHPRYSTTKSLTQRSLVNDRHEHASPIVGEEGGKVHALGDRLVALVVDSRDGKVVAGSDLGLLVNLVAQGTPQPLDLGTIDLDGSLNELGAVELLAAVVKRPPLEWKSAVGVDRLLVTRMGQGQRGQQQGGKQTLEGHGG